MEGMPSSLGYTTSSTQPIQESSSSKLPIPHDRRRVESGGGGGGILSSNPTLDQYHQFYVHQKENDPDPDPDLDPSQLPVAGCPSTSIQPPPPPQSQPRTESSNAAAARYRECLKNHAANIGGHVVDGCGEFMPSGEEGTPEALKCAACECHRNFHRREADGGESSQQLTTNYYYSQNPNGANVVRTPNHHIQPSHSHHHHHHRRPQHHHHFSHHYSQNLVSPTTGPVMMAFGGRGPAESSSEDLNMYQSSAAAGTLHVGVPPASKKRFRTKFSKEQKDRMQEVAEKIGWKIQKQDDDEVRQLCEELGVKRQVFKVWMHNNKQAMRKKQEQ